MKDAWLPRNFDLPEGNKVKALCFSGEGWQIFSTNSKSHILLAEEKLAHKWMDARLLEEGNLSPLKFGESEWQTLATPPDSILATVVGSSSQNTVAPLTFPEALKRSRSILGSEPSLHDAIFVEQLAVLLPTYSIDERVADDVVLGTWLTSGVSVSAKSFRRMKSLMPRLDRDTLDDILTAAGLSDPAEGDSLAVEADEDIEDKQEKTASSNSDRKKKKGKKGEFFSLPGRPLIEAFFNEHLVDIMNNPEKYKRMGIEHLPSIILHGPPGCGKTFAVERFIEFIDWPSFSIDSNSVGSPYIHQTSKKISEVFDKAIDAAPSVIVIDEMEAFLTARETASASGHHRVEEVAEFLRRIPEAIKSRVLIIAMTNMIDSIDPAILRRGRFDHKIEVGMPSSEEVRSLLDSLLSKIPKTDTLDIAATVELLTGKPLSDVAFVVREAARLAARAGKDSLDQSSLDAAFASLPQEKKKQRLGF